MYFIGITGGVGAGKTRILEYIKRCYKCEVYLADQVAHLVREPGTKAYQELLELLGRDVADGDGRIDNSLMAERIFADKELLDRVNEIIHPAVKRFLLERLEEAKKAGEAELFFVEAALLIEGGYLNLVDEMWYIYADEAVRKRRLGQERGYSEDKTARIMSRQLTEERFRESCAFVVDNSGSFRESRRQVDERLAALKAMKIQEWETENETV